MKRLYRSLLVLMITAALVITTFPAASVTAKSKNKGNEDPGYRNDNNGAWEDTDEEDDNSDFLVLVGSGNGSFVAYNDIAFITGGSHLMVKAKPLATALGLSYHTVTCGKHKKGISLSSGEDKNVYTKNSTDYYFYDYNSTTKQTTTSSYCSDYKLMIHESYYSVHYATLGTLVNYQYFNTVNYADYKNLGYSGVIVYNKYAAVSQLPSIASVTNLNGYVPSGNQNTNNQTNTNNNQNNSTSINITVIPSIISDTAFPDIKHVEASYSVAQTTSTQNLDLTGVQNTLKTFGLPYNGIFGSGNCETSVNIKAYDKNGYQVGELTTSGVVFLMNFPSAVKLVITGSCKNLILDFTPVVPTLITNTTRFPFSQVSWVYQSDGYARQYYVIADYMRFYPENISSGYSTSRKYLSFTNYSSPDYAACYQRVTAVFKCPYTELTSPNCYINFQKTSKSINNSLVVFNDMGTATAATDYEAKLTSMITSLSNAGSNIYFPSSNWNRQLVMKLTDNTVNTAYSYIMVDPSYLNLDYFNDYYLTLNEMVHFYEATRLHYGFRFPAWTEGNATTLAVKAMDAMNVNHKDSQGNDYIKTMYTTNYSFLTQSDKDNFEAYYLNVSGWNATVIGYHFTKFLQDMYGSDVIYKIMNKVYATNIPTNTSRTGVYDKQFTDCIKAVTSQNVFQLFVTYCVN